MTAHVRPGVPLGSRVKVWTLDEKKSLGFGTYLGDVHINVNKEGIIVSKLPGLTRKKVELPAKYAKSVAEHGFYSAKFILETGVTIYCLECNWEPAPEYSTRVH